VPAHNFVFFRGLQKDSEGKIKRKPIDPPQKGNEKQNRRSRGEKTRNGNEKHKPGKSRDEESGGAQFFLSLIEKGYRVLDFWIFV
jgi:hypothetical protein